MIRIIDELVGTAALALFVFAVLYVLVFFAWCAVLAVARAIERTKRQ